MLKVARIPVGNLNFGRTSFACAYMYTCACTYVAARVFVCRVVRVCRSKAVRSPMRRNGLWEPISPGYGSRGITAALFHPFPYYSRPRKRHHLRRHRPPRVSPSSFRSIARNPMKFQCGIPIKGRLRAGYDRGSRRPRRPDGRGRMIRRK